MESGAVKEFFYVDVDRTRSLLAQLQGGVIEHLTSETANTLEAGGNASIFGIGGSGGYSRSSSQQESRSFQEMIFVAFEALADEQHLISDLDESFQDPGRWENGDVHNELAEGQIVRLTCDVQILDGKLFGDRISRFEKMVDGIVSLSSPVTPRNSTPKQRQQLIAGMKADIMGGSSPEQLSAISGFVDAFVSEGISLRALACGRQHLELGFGGALLGRREYIQEERESLFSRYGVVASSWTCVLQIAAVPTKEAETAPGSVSDDLADVPVVDDEDIISRARMENIAVELLGLMEKIGIVEGPRWPTVSVTPLAVYRTIPTDR